MATWPTLSRKPLRKPFTQRTSDPTVRSETTDGRPLARDGVKPILDTFVFQYAYLTEADKGLLDTFQTTTVRVGATAFTWTDPRVGGEAHTVRLAAPMVFDLEEDGICYRTEVTLIEEPGY